MAGTALNYEPTKILVGPGKLWAGLAIPADDARITLDPDGTPDATANPNALHLGYTREGSTVNITPSFEGFNADEFAAPIKTKMVGLEMSLEFESLQVSDFDVMTKLVSGYGTYAAPTGFKEMRFGIGTQAYESIAFIYPTEADPTLYGVVNIYQAYCETGISAMQINRQQLSGVNCKFIGIDVTTRSADDTQGIWWEETA